MSEQQSRSFEVVYNDNEDRLVPQPQTIEHSQSLTIRSLLVILLLLLLLIPLYMVDKVVNQRAQDFQTVVNDTAHSWGQDQTITGPVLAVPYKEHITSVETITDSAGAPKTISRDVFKDKTLILLPESLDIKTMLNEAHHKRGIYDVLGYKANIEISGHFNLDALPRKGSRFIINWNKAWLSMGLSDTKALKNITPLRWQGSSANFAPGTLMTGILENGFHASMKDMPKGETKPEFKIQFNANGSDRFRFAPLGKTTTAQLKSSWKQPGFKGDISPNSKIISSEGFSADWNIPYLARNFPQSWLMGESEYKLDNVTTGVDLIAPVSLYSKISRAIKYGAIFIGLVFLSFLIFEVTVKKRVHIIQYGIIGLCLSLFYILLVSLSEHIPFMKAYLYAAGTTAGIITLYSFAVLRSFTKGLFILILLGSLYGALYFIIQRQEFALQAGAAVLLFVVLLLMLATWNIKTSE